MNKKILISDDDKEVVGFLAKGLNREGFETVVAFDGLEAKDKIIREQPDVIILDLIMPRMNGWEVLKWLRKDAKLATPTIIVSAKDEMADLKKGYSLEADTYLIKPVSIDDVLRGIHVVCSLKAES